MAYCPKCDKNVQILPADNWTSYPRCSFCFQRLVFPNAISKDEYISVRDAEHERVRQIRINQCKQKITECERPVSDKDLKDYIDSDKISTRSGLLGLSGFFLIVIGVIYIFKELLLQSALLVVIGIILIVIERNSQKAWNLKIKEKIKEEKEEKLKGLKKEYIEIMNKP